MTYIKTYGTYIPQFTIADNLLHPKGRKNNHAIAYVDEDIITLAYEAVANCQVPTTICDAIIFATNTPVFKDRYHASFLAGLLGLPQGITALDLGTTNRAGTDALLLADTLVSSGKHENVLVVAADIRFPSIGEEARTPFGHGAAALIVSKEPGIAEITCATSYSTSLSEEFTYKGEKVQYDGRFAKTAGFKENMKKVLQELDPGKMDNLIINSAYVKLTLAELKKVGFDMEKQVIPDTLIPQCGYSGSAHGLLRLIDALNHKKGTSVLVDYNNGSNVITIESLRKESDPPIIGNKSEAITSYQDYLTMRKQGNFKSKGYESTEIFSSEMIQEREKDQLVHLKGFECKGCGTIYFMKAARCNNCKKTEFREKQLSKTGVVYTLTGEHYFPNSFPPTNMIVIDLENGGRVTLQQTDDMYRNEHSKLNIGDKVKLVFRKMMENDSKPNYFWKCVKELRM